jgi:hypothetical protein
VLLAIAVAAVVLTCLAMGIVRTTVLAGATQRFLDAARNAGPAGFVAFAILQLIVAASGVLPASVLGIAAGAADGLPLGFLLAALGTMAGALLSFGLSRSLFRNVVARKLARHPGLARFDALLAQDGRRVVCLLRISPCRSPRRATRSACRRSEFRPMCWAPWPLCPRCSGMCTSALWPRPVGVDDGRRALAMGHFGLRRIRDRGLDADHWPLGAPRHRSDPRDGV